MTLFFVFYLPFERLGDGDFEDLFNGISASIKKIRIIQNVFLFDSLFIYFANVRNLGLVWNGMD